MSRLPIAGAELAVDLKRLNQAAQVIVDSLVYLTTSRYAPPSCLPSIHAAKRAAISLLTHTEAATTLVDQALNADPYRIQVDHTKVSPSIDSALVTMMKPEAPHTKAAPRVNPAVVRPTPKEAG